MLALTLSQFPGALQVPLHLTLNPQRVWAPSLPIQPLHQRGTDLVGVVLDFHQEYDVTAFDDLQRENSQGVESTYYKQ